MAIDKALYKIINKFGSSEFEVRDKNGELIGTERAQISSLKRSSDQNLAAFMRMGSFHSESILEPGCILYDIAKNERFVLATRNAQGLSRKITHYTVYLLKVNTLATVTRREMVISSTSQAETSFEDVSVCEDEYCYMKKKDWTMEQITFAGREQRGYEEFVFRITDNYIIQVGDRIEADGNKYIIQYMSLYKDEGYYVIQGGIEVR